MKWIMSVAVVLIGTFVLFTIYGTSDTGGAGVRQSEDAVSVLPFLPDDPRNASYDIEGEEVSFDVDADNASAQGFTMQEEVVFGDVNNDGREDAVVIIKEKGTDTARWYIATALASERGGFIGGHAFALSEGAVPHDPSIAYGIISVTLAHPTSSATTTARFLPIGTSLTPLAIPDDAFMVMRGTYREEDGTLVFTSCDTTHTATIAPSSRAFVALRAIYRERLGERGEGGTDVPIVFVARTLAPEQGDEHMGNNELLVTRIIDAPLHGACLARDDVSTRVAPASSTSTATVSTTTLR